MRDVLRDAVVGVTVDHRTHEVGEVGGIAHRQLADLGDELLLDPRPQRARDVGPRGRGAFLTLELERAADQRGDQRLHVGRLVGEDEVLAAGLADDARVVLVAVDVVADRLPHALEHLGGAGEVDAGQVGAGQHRVADRASRAGDHVDHAGRQPGLFQKLHDVVRGEQRRRGRFPQADVAHQRRGGRQVAGDAREVERRHREHEALQRPVLEVVPAAVGGAGLLGVDLLHVVRVEAEEVDQLAGRVDLRLVRGLGLAEHRRGVEHLAVRTGQQVGGLEEDRGAVVPRHARPGLVRVERGLDGAIDLLLAALVPRAQHVRVVVRHHRLGGLARADLLAADPRGNVDDLA